MSGGRGGTPYAAAHLPDPVVQAHATLLRWYRLPLLVEQSRRALIAPVQHAVGHCFRVALYFGARPFSFVARAF